MKPSALERLTAYAQSARFMAFQGEGAQVVLANGERAPAQIESLHRSERPRGLRFARHAFACRFRVGDQVASGFGEADHELGAVQKCIAEGFERATFLALDGTEFRSSTSNGWAAHLTRDLARAAALEELAERDAVLVHWLTQTPMVGVELADGPRWLSEWTSRELSLGSRHLRIVVSTLGHAPTATTVLLDAAGYGVLSHSAASTLERAVYKALAETCRIAQLAEEGTFFETSRKLVDEREHEQPQPEDHALLFAHHCRLPEWLFGEARTWAQADREWREHRFRFENAPPAHDFEVLARGPLVVGRASSARVQNLFFGRTESARRNGLLNVDRLGTVAREGAVNLMPHCIA